MPPWLLRKRLGGARAPAAWISAGQRQSVRLETELREALTMTSCEGDLNSLGTVFTVPVASE